MTGRVTRERPAALSSRDTLPPQSGTGVILKARHQRSRSGRVSGGRQNLSRPRRSGVDLSRRPRASRTSYRAGASQQRAFSRSTGIPGPRSGPRRSSRKYGDPRTGSPRALEPGRAIRVPVRPLLTLAEGITWLAVEGAEGLDLDELQAGRVHALQKGSDLAVVDLLRGGRKEAAAPVVGTECLGEPFGPDLHTAVRDHCQLETARARFPENLRQPFGRALAPVEKNVHADSRFFLPGGRRRVPR